MTGDELLQVLATLANPHRLRVVAALAEERNYVSQLARELGISRALLQVHLRKLEAAGLVSAIDRGLRGWEGDEVLRGDTLRRAADA